MNKLSIVIPAAGLGRRMKSYGPKAMLKLGSEPLIVRQVRLLAQVFPSAEIVVVVGFGADKIRRALPAGVKLIYNAEFEETNVARSVAAGIKAAKGDRVLVVYGDLVFNRKTVQHFAEQELSCLLTASGGGREGEVGVNVVDGHALYFSHGLPTIWAHMVLLTGLERHLFLQIASDCSKARHFAYEIFNLLLEHDNTTFRVLSPNRVTLAEIDTSKDIEKAIEIARRGD